MRRPPAASVAALAAAAFLAQSCATPKPFEYGPIGEKQPFGYQDRDNPDGGHTVLVVMPAATSPGEARATWDRRAEELCPAGIDRRNVFRVDRPENFVPAMATYNSVGVGSRIALSIQVEGYVYCKPAAKAEQAAKG